MLFPLLAVMIVMVAILIVLAVYLLMGRWLGKRAASNTLESPLPLAKEEVAPRARVGE